MWVTRSKSTRLSRPKADRYTLGSVTRPSAVRPIGVVRRLARAKDRLTDTHDGRAFLDREFIIAGHAHREIVHRDPVRNGLAQTIAEFTQTHEAWTHFRGILREQRQRHQPAHA